ncbi:hypothetical protein HDV00_003787 [Rhizophlyctis rosea]|nr:hypothetical protein HDV00_003787 [Rhizophlyctis rosea]
MKPSPPIPRNGEDRQQPSTPTRPAEGHTTLSETQHSPPSAFAERSRPAASQLASHNQRPADRGRGSVGEGLSRSEGQVKPRWAPDASTFGPEFASRKKQFGQRNEEGGVELEDEVVKRKGNHDNKGRDRENIISMDDDSAEPESGRERGSKRGGRDDKARDRERREREHDKKRREREEREERARKKELAKAKQPKHVHVYEGISAFQLSQAIGVHFGNLNIDYNARWCSWALRMLSILIVSTTQAEHQIMEKDSEIDGSLDLSAEDASSVALEYNMEPIVPTDSGEDLEPRLEPEDWSTYPSRPPVVTIMGHVDHGKTTLLDSLRKTSVAAGEAGGITQHIGAFSVVLPSGQRITFMDTPGHAAFSAMRARGAKTTDVVVLVVAADDGIMPQTVEAIKHAKAADVPIIVAINKCDKPNVKIKAVKEGLLQHEVILEEYGGEIPAVEVSGLTGKGLDELEETIVTLSEVMDLRGDPEGHVEAVVVEAKQAHGRGNVATLLVKRGTLRPGAVIVAGNVWCKVRSLHDENLNTMQEAGPAQPVEVIGWKGLPEAGDEVLEAESEDLAKEVIETRLNRVRRTEEEKGREQLNEKRARRKAMDEADNQEATPTLETENGEKVLHLILKADVQGSLEALVESIYALPAHEVRANIVDSGVGPVNPSDVKMAEATGVSAKIIAFNVPKGKQIPNTVTVDIREYNIIYRLLDDVKEMLSDMLPMEVVMEVTGEAEILDTFQINIKKGTDMVAGCRVNTGVIKKANKVRVMRGGEKIYDGELKNFKHHKKDITEASKGLECGMNFENFKEFQKGDIIQGYSVTERKRKII